MSKKKKDKKVAKNPPMQDQIDNLSYAFRRMHAGDLFRLKERNEQLVNKLEARIQKCAICGKMDFTDRMQKKPIQMVERRTFASCTNKKPNDSSCKYDRHGYHLNDPYDSFLPLTYPLALAGIETGWVHMSCYKIYHWPEDLMKKHMTKLDFEELERENAKLKQSRQELDELKGFLGRRWTGRRLLKKLENLKWCIW